MVEIEIIDCVDGRDHVRADHYRSGFAENLHCVQVVVEQHRLFVRYSLCL